MASPTVGTSSGRPRQRSPRLSGLWRGERVSGRVRKPGKVWTLGIWLEHWVESIAEKYVSENAYDRYEVDVRVQLVPGVRAHKLDRLEPEYLGTFHAKMAGVEELRRHGSPRSPHGPRLLGRRSDAVTSRSTPQRSSVRLDHRSARTGGQASSQAPGGTGARARKPGELWEDKGSADPGHHRWKQLPADAGVRDGRLPAARQTAGTVLLLFGVPDVVVDAITGRAPGGAARMRARSTRVTSPMLKRVVDQVGEALWGPPDLN